MSRPSSIVRSADALPTGVKPLSVTAVSLIFALVPVPASLFVTVTATSNSSPGAAKLGQLGIIM